MRWVVFLLLLIGSLTLLSSPVEAFYISNHACEDPSQQKQCSCDTLTSSGLCDLNDARTICTPCQNPSSLAPLPSPIPSPTISSVNTPVVGIQNDQSSIISTSPAPSSSSREEQAIYNLNKTSPVEAIDSSSDKQTLINRVLSTAGSKLSGVFGLFFQPPKDPGRLYAESESRARSVLPPQVRPDTSKPVNTLESLVKQLQGFLGSSKDAAGNKESSGYYDAFTPEVPGFSDGVKGGEQRTDQGWFPSEVNIIIPNSI